MAAAGLLAAVWATGFVTATAVEPPGFGDVELTDGAVLAGTLSACFPTYGTTCDLTATGSVGAGTGRAKTGFG